MGIFDSTSTNTKVENRFADNRQDLGGQAFGVAGNDRSAIGGSAPVINISQGNKSKTGSIYITDVSDAVVSDTLSVLNSVFSDLTKAQQSFAAQQSGAFSDLIEAQQSSAAQQAVQQSGAFLSSLEFVSQSVGQAFDAGKSADERSSGRVLLFGGAIVIVALFAVGGMRL